MWQPYGINNMKEYILTSDMAKGADAAAPKYGVSLETLMDRAAKALFETVCEYSGKILILCGKGNNGGDGYALCDLLLKEGRDVACVSVIGGEKSPLCEKKYSALPEGFVLDMEADFDAVAKLVEDAGVIVDCIFGTGFEGATPAELVPLFEVLAGKRIVACDIPSCVRCDRGGSARYYIVAEKTVTFAFYKPCMFMFPARDYCGEIILADIGMPEEAIREQGPTIEFIDAQMVRDIIKPRCQNGHKGTFGTVQLVCGSDLMTGAAAFACKGALKSGVGLVYLSLPEKARQILQSTIYEPVYTMPDAMVDVYAQVVGPGLGVRTPSVWKNLCRPIRTVVDADAVRLIAKRELEEGVTLPMRKMLLTPHPAEFGSLIEKRAKEVEDDRFRLARDYAVRKQCVLLLKGKYTLIALPDGRILVNRTGNSGLSKGGSGDVLAGFAGGLLAQKYSCEEAAIVAAYLHGRAADALVANGREEAEIQPSDIVEYIGRKEYLLGTL